MVRNPVGASWSTAFTMAFAVGVSMFVSFALTPTLIARLLSAEAHQQGKGAVTIPGRPLEGCPRKVEGMTSIGP